MTTHKAPQFLRHFLLLGGFMVAAAHAADFHHDASGNLTNIQAAAAVRPSLPYDLPPTQVGLGEPLSLTVPVQNAGAASYQWFRNGTAIPGATSAFFHLAATTLADGGRYSVVVSNAYGGAETQSCSGSLGCYPLGGVDVVFQPAYESFASSNGLALVGSASLTNQQLRLTPSAPGNTGSAWFQTPIFCRNGFTARFQFRITDLTGAGAEGLSFCLQRSGTNLVMDEKGLPYVVLDASGQGHNGTPLGASMSWPPWEPSLVGGPGASYAVRFNGVNDYVDLGTGVVLGPQFTEEAWILPTPADAVQVGDRLL